LAETINFYWIVGLVLVILAFVELIENLGLGFRQKKLILRTLFRNKVNLSFFHHNVLDLTTLDLKS
jgi:hypothetical protein